jgi:hypothetical protein
VKRLQRESGQALIAAAFGLVVLLGAAGLAIDLGYLRYERRLQQSAADSAAIAGAAESAAGNATTAARQDAKLNGFNNGVNSVTVNVNPAFPFGAVTGVQVQVQAVHPTFFMRIFGVNNSTVSTTAVAINSNAKNCIYALNNFGTAINNIGTVTASGCGLIDNSNLLNTGSINAASVAVHGSASGSATIPAAILGIIGAGDPLYRLTPPGGGGCTANPNISGAGPPFTAPPINPGRYCTGITIAGSKNVTFTAGTYIISGGGLSINGTGTVTGAGVTIYIAGGGGTININNVAGSARNLTLVAPTTGARAGILFYQNPGNTQTANIKGTAASLFQGIFYFPKAHLNLTNTGTATPAYMMAVVQSLTLTGTVHFASNFASLPGGSPIKRAVLAE